MNVGHLADLALELLGVQHVAHGAAGGLIHAAGRIAQLLFLGVHADDHGVGSDGGEGFVHDRDVHGRLRSASACARLIMSSSPSVVSSRATSLTSTQAASSASLAAHSVPDSTNAT